ncbi:sodium:solute symporter family protein [Fulvivirga sp. M361]|uniref:sodium:solute symporter family protein n=1 Tax=Fulvivirga sp. M361 TaxID=2594266 RepID=UPI00117ABEC5|nr:sodium:solute symporter family protein [Fulvivirga sp. M361]TRX48123.1 sodium:solute symporter family protein [Fulvivirga sp. M361]
MTYIIVTSLYLLVLIGIIIYKSRSVKTEEDFVVAGRGVPVYLLVGTLVCTWIGSGSLFGTAGLTFRTGFSELWFSAGAWIGIIFVYFIAARVRKIAKYTLTDLLETRYNNTARLLGTITIIVAYLVIAGYQFKGGGRFINILTEGAVSAETGMLLSCIVIIAFTALAGMVSIISIDIFNGVIMTLAMIFTLPLAISSHGGWSQVIDTINEKSPEYLSLFEGHDATWVLGIILPTFLLLMSESSMYQKFSSAKDAKSAKKAVVGMLIGVVVIEFLMCTIAVVGYAIYAEDARFFLADGSVNRGMAEEIILRIGFEQIPAYAGSLLFAAGMAIILSTGNTFLMVTSTNVTRDLIAKYIYKKGESFNTVKIQRVTVVVLGLIAYLLVTQFETILEMAFISYTMIGASLAPVLLASFFWKRVTPTGGLASIISGMSVPVINKVMEVSGTSFSLFGVSFPVDTDYIAIPSLVLSLAALVIGSLLTPHSPEEKWKPFFPDSEKSD